MSRILSDEDRMPFGKYKGQRLGDVPDDYWLWLLRQEWFAGYADLLRYAKVVEKVRERDKE